MAVAIKQKAYPIDAIAKAQKSLMKPEERLVADFLLPSLSPLQKFQCSDLSTSNQDMPVLDILPDFDKLGDVIRDNQTTSSLDLQIGKNLAEYLTLDFE